MLRYVLYRILKMAPIVAGVVLLTFVLFNVVGGSPAAVVLGKNASARALEEFDEQRGFNKPLIAGLWTDTRALPDEDFDRPAAPWLALPGAPEARVTGDGALLVPGGESEFALPLVFPLRPETAYRLTLELSLPEGGRATVACATCPDPPLELAAGSGERQRVTFDFTTAEKTATGDLVVRVAEGPLRLHGVALRRRMAHILDSQLVFYLSRLARFDLGTSTQTNQRVSTILLEGIPPSLTHTVPIFAGGLLLGLLLAVVCAWFRDRPVDRLLVVLATALMSVNYIVWIVAGQYLFGYKLGWFPIWGYESWAYLVLPVCIGIVSGLGRDVRFYRTVVLDEMYREYVRTARAKGLSTSAILFGHVLRNALVPVLTNVSMTIPFLFTGSLLLESFFGIPGLGSVSVNAINSSDMDVLRAVVLIGALLYVLVNLLTDLCYAWADPRVRLR